MSPSRCLTVRSALVSALAVSWAGHGFAECPAGLLFARHGRICYQPPLWLAARSVDAVQEAVRKSLDTWLPCESRIVRVVEVGYADAALRWAENSNARFTATAQAITRALAARAASRACPPPSQILTDTVRFENTSRPTAEETRRLLTSIRRGAAPVVLIASKEILVALGDALVEPGAGAECPRVGSAAEAWRTRRDDSDYFYAHLWAVGEAGFKELPVDYSHFDDCRAINGSGGSIPCARPRACVAAPPSMR